MFWQILVVISVLSVAIGLIMYIRGRELGGKIFITAILCMFLSIVGGLVASFTMAALIKPQYSETEILHSSKEIENMEDNRDVTGEFSGNLFYTKGQENTEYYYYFMKKENDTLVPDKIKATDTKIKYITDGKPRIDTYVYYEETKVPEHFSGELFWFTFPDLVTQKLEEQHTEEKSYEIAYYILYVPEDSVSHEYNIDLK